MKKILLIITLIIVANTANAKYPNPIVKRLSDHEISECSTPSSTAYNYVMAILMKDYYIAVSYLEEEYAYKIIRDLGKIGSDKYDQFFNDFFCLSDWPDWRQALACGYALIATDINDECWAAKTEDGWMIHPNQVVKDGMVYIPGEEEPYVGIYSKNIYVACCPISEVNYTRFNDVKWYNNTLLRISVKLDHNKWVIENSNIVNLSETL